MAGPLWQRARSRRIFWRVSAIAVLAAAPAFAGRPPVVDRAAPSPVTAVTSQQLQTLPTNRDMRTILDYHNQLRAEFGSAPLRWNPELAAGAAAYGPVLSQGGTLAHASREGRRTVRENLLQSPRGVYSPLQMVQVWGREKQRFRPGVFPDVSTDGNWASVGHYTQMVWPTTTDLGCAIHSDPRFDWLICRYSPPGNRDGTAIGPSIPRLAGGLCTGPTGTTIPCNNDPKVAEDGGLVDDGGGEIEDSGEEEEVCPLDVNVHKPISVAPDEPVVAQDEELTKGAITLRNDDSDRRLGELRRTELPVVSLPTDVESDENNPNENDLVRVDAINQPGLPNVYLFAFPIDAEANRNLGTRVEPGDGRQANQARKPPELGYFTTATKGGAAPGLPRLIPQGTTTFWVEAKLGGRYRFVIQDLQAGDVPAKVRYNRKTNKTDAKATCEDQATVTAAVVDIYQERDSKRLTAFDVYWGGRPHFKAEVWPGGNTYTWGERYRLAAAERPMPGTAVDGMVASMDKDDEDAPGDGNAKVDGPIAVRTGQAGGAGAAKGKIENGGFQMDTPPGTAPGDVPAVNRNRGDRYRDRVSLKYQVNGEPLVRAEYLEVILPEVAAPAAAQVTGSPTGVASQVRYTIVDAFGRPIKARSIPDYLHLYGAGLKAWEALMQGRDTPNLIERGRKNDFLQLVNVGVDAQGRPLEPLTFGTAQRSQAQMHENRMTRAEFTDTLALDLLGNEDEGRPGYDDNHQKYLWMAWTGVLRRTPDDGYDSDATRRAEQERRDEAQDRLRDQQRGRDTAAADAGRIRRQAVLSIPQDVVLQLRVGTQRHDLMVLERNMIALYPPYFFKNFQGYNPRAPRRPSNNVFYYHIDFQPGRVTSRLVISGHQRP